MMTKRQLMDMLEEVAEAYVKKAKDSLNQNSHMHELTIGEYEALTQNQIDAIVVDFINTVGVFQGLDEGFYTHYLIEK